MTEPPVPQTARWQPVRAGLVDLFFYDYQEFWFRDGRLLLRGNNGTGKSKVLALTLLFLLDADLSPTRIEPDGDRDKKMEWNLLLGGRYDERLGYTWLEFGRRTEDGEHAYFTVGCGLKAAAGRGIADRWYFITSQRIGLDLFLIGGNGIALTRDRLIAAIGDYGQVTQKAEQYRRAIDEHLFHLGPDRYAALVDLLIQLRQPQLSKRPNEERLSKALSQALSPVDQAVLSDIATAFHDLEQQRAELAGLRDTRGHVGRFVQRYQHYARVSARRRGRELRSAQSAYEAVGRDLSGVRDLIEQARTAEQQAADRIEQVAAELVELRAARDELAGRPELTSIEHAERHAAETTRTAATAAARLRKASDHRDERQRRQAAAVQAAERTRDALLHAADRTGAEAGKAGIGGGHAELLGRLELPDGGGQGLAEPLVDAAADQARQLARRRRDAANHVLGLARAAEQADEAATGARRLLRDREGLRDAAADRSVEADGAVVAAASALVTAWQAYAAAATELAVPYPDEIGLDEWAQTLDAANPASAALRVAAAASTQVLASAHAQAVARAEEIDAGLATLQQERQRLEAGETSRPPVPYTRGDNVRDGRPGAPLWQVTDYADDVDDAARAGLEAGLEAAGLLDAWITPDGRLLDSGTHDVVVAAGATVDHNLAGVLRPAIDAADPQSAALSVQTVEGVLAAIRLGTGDAEAAGAASIDPTGAWRVGPLHGAWSKSAAEYIGAGAREEARRRRLDALAAEIAATVQALDEALEAVAAIEARQQRLAAELAAEPSDQALRDAHGVAAGAAAELGRARARVAEQEEVVRAAEGKAAEAVRARNEAAHDLHLPASMEELHNVLEAVDRYLTAALELVAAVRRHGDKLADLLTWSEELQEAVAALDVARGEARAADETARDARSRLETLREALGATADELRRRLSETKDRIGALDAEGKRLGARHTELTRELGQAEGREQQLLTDLSKEAERRDAAVQAFQRFAATGLLTVAAPDLDVPDPTAPWAADPAVRLARRAEQVLAEIDDGDEAWKRIQDDIGRRFTELSEALTRHGHHTAMNLEDDRLLVTIQFQGRDRAPLELAGLLDDEIDYRNRMLTARERELIEEHLVNDVASHLQELISDAEAQVEQMNAELAERPTSTGMRLRLRWEPKPDGPSGLVEARRRLLRQDADLWTPEDRAAVGDFLQRQIETERSRDDEGTWQEQLRRALDYRGWHRFVIERMQDGRWRSATGPASGGERVLTVSLPLFAAASAHYRSAHPHAPRLVLLDEAFAGVDDDARAKCLGLLATFDLDVVMTSEREWGFYATVPGIATHQLVRRDGVDAVHVTAWEWNGRTAERVDRTFVPRQPAGSRSHPAAAEDTGLW